jgi:general secretion pathway protein L
MAFVLWFRGAGLIFLVASGFWMAGTLMETDKLGATTEAVYAETEALFRSSFPDVKRIANMRAQARQEVMKLRQQSGGEFLKLSGILFKETSLSDGTLMDGLRFDNARGELAVTLSFASYAEGEAFKKKLTAAGVDVTEGGSRQEGARVATDLVLRSAS